MTRRTAFVTAFLVLQGSTSLWAQVLAPPGTIDGAERPAVIPDLVAFRLFLRSLVPQPVTPGQQQAARKAVALNAVRKARLRETLRLTEAEGSALQAIFEEFEQRVGAIDRQAAQIKPLEAHSPQAAKVLAHLQRQRDAVILQLIDALPERLGA